jgi:ferrous iron transport protein A
MSAVLAETPAQSTELATVADLLPGQTGMVVAFAGSSPTRQRLMEMGMTRGAVVRMVRSAPLGDPIELSVRGYRLSLRRAEASAVTIRMS